MAELGSILAAAPRCSRVCQYTDTNPAGRFARKISGMKALSSSFLKLKYTFIHFQPILEHFTPFSEVFSSVQDFSPFVVKQVASLKVHKTVKVQFT